MPYPAALTLTLAIEVPLYVAMLGGWPNTQRPAPLRTVTGWQMLLLGVGVNLASHPAAMLVAVPALRGHVGPTAALALAEVAVLVLEAAIVWWRVGNYLAAVAASAIANLTSLTVGFMVAG